MSTKEWIDFVLREAGNEFPNPVFRANEAVALASRALSSPGACIELRAIGNKSAARWEEKQTKVGFFSDIEAFTKACETNHRKHQLYLGLNPRKAALLHAAPANQLSSGEGGKADDVLVRRFFPIDIDTIRASSRIAATDIEIEAAVTVFDSIKVDLAKKGIQVVEGFSGNGLHGIIETVEYPNEKGLNEKNGPFALLVRYFDRKYTIGGAKVDTTTYDIGRVWKTYGTAAVKGANTQERPWRTARLAIPTGWPPRCDIVKLYAEEIAEQAIFEDEEEIGGKKSKKKPSSSKARTSTDAWSHYSGALPSLDIVSLCKEASLYERPISGNVHAAKCPWREEHTSGQDGDGSTVIFEAQVGKWPGWHCKHDHCASRDLSDFLGTFDSKKVDMHCAKSFDEKNSRNSSEHSCERKLEFPEIQINGRQQREVIYDCWRLVHSLNEAKPEIFLRGNVLVQPSFGEHGNGALVEVLNVNMSGHLIRSVDLVKINDKGETCAANLPDYVPKDMTAIPDKALLTLNTITGSPYFNKNSQLVTAQGYHQKDEVFLHYPMNCTPIEKIADVSATEARARIEWLMSELLSDFPFATQLDRVHALVGFFQPLLRKMIAGPTPMLLINAAVPGSGKSLLAQIMSVIATGDIIAARVLSSNEDERKKMFISELVRGRPLILLDNLDDESGDSGRSSSDRLHSPSLAAILTSVIYTDRVLGASKMVEAPNEALWLMTGNNPQLSLELSRRCISIRIEAESERPWERGEATFKHPEIINWTMKNRRSLLEALLTCTQSWIVAGQPLLPGKSYGSYESWTSIMRSLLGFLGFDSFLANQGKIGIAVDPTREVWLEFIGRWHERFGRKPVNAGDLLSAIDSNLLIPLMGFHNDVTSKKISLGKLLSKTCGRIFGGYKIAIVPHSEKEANHYTLIPLPSPAGGSGEIRGNQGEPLVSGKDDINWTGHDANSK